MTSKEKAYFCPACKNYKNRGISIDTVIIIDSKILLVRRGKDPFNGLWALPGGHVDFDETLEDALVREVKEETGLDVVSLQFLGIYSSPERHPGQSIAIAYRVKASGEIKTGDDAIGYKLFRLANLPEKLAFDHRKIIQDYICLDTWG